ncbi:uncharacterized protein J3R85_011566 [Psidium guajava]|nr:uncharacterized protein J3R85_011566 [Psidium guajava]
MRLGCVDVEGVVQLGRAGNEKEQRRIVRGTHSNHKFNRRIRIQCNAIQFNLRFGPKTKNQ